MDITLDTLRRRHSVRTFTAPCDPEQIRRLNAVITDINTHGIGLHFQLITNSPAAFNSFTKSYGMFKGVSDYVACVVDTSYANWLQRAGYYGMQLVTEAVAIGLGTCFVSGSYSKADVSARIRVGQELVMLIALGQSAPKQTKGLVPRLISSIAMKHGRLTPMDFLDTQLPWETICNAFPLLYQGLEAVSYAPSALNKQPVGILIKKHDDPYNPVTAKQNKSGKQQERQQLAAQYESLLRPTVPNQPEYILQAYVPAKNRQQLIDLGIAMFSFSIAYPGTWDWGNPATFLPY